MQANDPHLVATKRDKGGWRSGADRRVNAIMVVIPERRRRGERRLPLVVEGVDVSDSVLVVDARGSGLSPCLFPEIVTETGVTLYDTTTAERKAGTAAQPPGAASVYAFSRQECRFVVKYSAWTSRLITPDDIPQNARRLGCESLP